MVQSGATADPADRVVAVEGLTKRFGSVTAVDGLTFTVQPGRVTGFLGPNGAGKTTTMRMLLSLVRPTSGTATIGGRRYPELADPFRTVGASLEATGFHPGRSGRNHLRTLGTTAGILTDPQCVKQEGSEAKEVGCDEEGAFSIVSKEAKKEDCADQSQPFVLIERDGKSEILCLAPAKK